MTAWTVDLPVPARALAIGAHADDVEFGAGATLAKWAASGTLIRHVICTDGSKGSWDPNEDIEKLITVRQEEQRAASRVLGGSGDVEFLGYVDGELTSDLDARAAVAAAIRRFRPDVVLGHDPWRRYRLHPDHRHAGYLAVEGIVAARDPHFFPEQGLQPHRPSTLLLFEADQPDHVERVDGFADAKIAALLAHRSQHRSTMHISSVHTSSGHSSSGDDHSDDSDVVAFRQLILDRLAEHGRLTTGRLTSGTACGEAFKALTDL